MECAIFPMQRYRMQALAWVILVLLVGRNDAFQSPSLNSLFYNPLRRTTSTFLLPSPFTTVLKKKTITSSLLYSSSSGDDDIVNVILLDDDMPEDLSSSMGAWVPVGSISSLQGITPTNFEIMGRQFAVWKCNNDDGNETWSVVTDECPHRMAPLSLGRVDSKTNCIECPYHGWQFDKDGVLQRIPHLEPGGDLKAESRSITAFATHLTGDILWTFLPTSFHGESFPKDLLPEHYYYGLQDFMNRNVTFYAQEVAFSFDFFVENVIDGPAHAYFAHHKSGFRREQAGPIPCKIAVSNFTFLAPEVKYVREGRLRSRRYAYQRPFLTMIQQPDGIGTWKSSVLNFGIPIREGWTRILTSLDVLKPHPWTPDWVLHTINQRFLEGDLIVHYAEIASRTQRSVLPNYIYATSSDASSKAWRMWWNKYGLSTAPPNTFGPASAEKLQLLNREQLLDAWKYHTSKCSKCRGALQKTKLVRRAGIALMIWSAALLSQKASLARLLMGGLGAGVTVICEKIIVALQGPRTRSDFPDRSFAARN